MIRTTLLLLSVCCLSVLQSGAQETEPDAKAKTEALYYDAVKAHILGNDKESETLLQQVIKQQPDEPAPYYDLARLAAGGNKIDMAEDYIKRALELDNTNKYYREQYANILVLRNNYEEAATQFANLAKDEKHNEEYLLKAAILHQRSGQYKKAIAELDELDKKSHGDDDILLQKEQVYLKMNDVESAAGVFQELIKRNPKEPRWYNMLGDLYENNKQPEKAKAVYAQMKEKFPNDPTLQLSLAGDALKKGDTAQYREYVRKAITNKELDAETQLRILGPYLQEFTTDSLQRKEALRLIVQLVAQHPNNINAILAYADILSINNQGDEAAVQYKKAVNLDPSKFDRWQKLLNNYTDRKDADSLIKYGEKAARLFPNQATVHYYIGIGYYNKKNYPEAAKAYNRAIDLQPEEAIEQLAGMYSSLGDTYYSMKNYVQSDSAFEHSLRLNKNNASVLNNYAYYLSERKVRLEDAARMSKRSLELRPDEGTFLDTYGWILYQQAKYDEARSYIKKAIDAAGNNADATLYEHLAAVEYKLGSVDKAIDAWRTAKSKGSENTNLDKMIADHKLYE